MGCAGAESVDVRSIRAEWTSNRLSTNRCQVGWFERELLQICPQTHSMYQMSLRAFQSVMLCILFAIPPYVFLITAPIGGRRMATETRSESLVDGLSLDELAAGAIGGFLGSVLMGLVMQFGMPGPTLEMAIPAMYGIEGPALLAGWTMHQFHGVVLGLVYVVLVQFEPLRRPARRVESAIVLGIGYGVLTTMLLSVLVMPVWLSAVGFPSPPPFPNVGMPNTLLSVLAHVLYAIPVATAYALIKYD